jgi:hypothetical protein
MMAISTTRVKALCNASELSLVRLSGRTELAKLSPAQLKQKVARARALRDKWSDQARTQRRATQTAQRARQTDDNARSAEKAEIFGEVLTRFETQLAKVEAKGVPAGATKKKLAPRARSATHRAERAEVRDLLKEKRLTLKEKGMAAKPKTSTKTSKPTVERVAVFPEAAGDATAAARELHTTAPGKGKKKAGVAGLTAMQAARELQGLRVTKAQQLRATTTAKQARLRASGIMRVQKSTSAANKRRQAKRDSK